MKLLWKVKGSFNRTSWKVSDVQIVRYTWVLSLSACTIHVGIHPARSATTASTVLAGTHNLVDTNPRAGTGPFPKPRALVLPLVHFGQSKPEGHGY